MKIRFCLVLLISVVCLSCNNGKTPERFEIGKKTFLLNDKPFVVKAAEIHYPRIPREYWEQRIEMCKALGMNTICLYVFWNLHEETIGNFDFSGNKDIAAFCRLVQKHGMYVIVRPGPYVCAEWEMGGLPWWLLKEDDVKLRTLDPFYMSRVGIFMEKVGRELADLQITRGGNIIMVQVENEYGSYGVDKPYVSAIRDIVRKNFEVTLFQCDWSSNFLDNALDDLLWTINFGTGADIDAQFAKLKEIRPDSPLMCSEFWSGWFDHWGRKHETRDGNVMVEGLKEMLDKNISFSLYMTHGGTTFGQWGGANNPAYSAMCSSYDYDAPISEAGWTTDKYFALREMLSKYIPEGEQLADIPKPFPVMKLAPIYFTEIAPLFENLPESKKSERIFPMEKFDQGWGTILYRTKLPKVESGTILKITEQHDWTQVYVNGRLLRCLDRRLGEQEVLLPSLGAGATLDLLVEAMGRVNFDKSIHDRKGITEKVELIKGDSVVELYDWSIYNFPINYSFVKNKQYTKKQKINVPAYYRATFNLDKVADTFLNMETWGKGMVWVNGHAMGRFWEIGPQQTLFMPSCWLNKGENEIIVLDLKGPDKAVIEGLEKPILDKLRVDVPKTHRQQGQTLDLKQEKVVIEGKFKKQPGWQTIKFSVPVKGRYLCLEALGSFDGTNVATIAELNITDVDGRIIPREKWTITYADTEETRSGNRTADKIFDLQESTFWQTVDNVAYPHQLVIDLHDEYLIGGIEYLPCVEVNNPGLIKDYKVYIKQTDFKY